MTQIMWPIVLDHLSDKKWQGFITLSPINVCMWNVLCYGIFEQNTLPPYPTNKFWTNLLKFTHKYWLKLETCNPFFFRTFIYLFLRLTFLYFLHFWISDWEWKVRVFYMISFDIDSIRDLSTVLPWLLRWTRNWIRPWMRKST